MSRTKKITKEAKIKRDIKVALLATVAATAAATAAAAVTSFKLLADVAVNKTLPKRVYKMQDKLSGGGTDKEILNMINENGELLKRTVTERVAIQSHDGLTLVGHWYPAENAKRIVVAMHGWRSCGFWNLCPVYARHGVQRALSRSALTGRERRRTYRIRSFRKI